MKKITALFALFLLILVACGDDDSNSGVNTLDPATGNITGKWFESKSKEQGDTDWMPVDNEYECKRGFTTFGPGNNFTSHSFFDVSDTCTEQVSNSAYTRNGRFFTIVHETGNTSVFEITYLTTEEMHIKLISYTSETGSDLTYYFELLLTRN